MGGRGERQGQSHIPDFKCEIRLTVLYVKLTDHLLATNSFGVCARASGGHNAGHTVKTGGKCVNARRSSL